VRKEPFQCSRVVVKEGLEHIVVQLIPALPEWSLVVTPQRIRNKTAVKRASVIVPVIPHGG